MKYYNFQKQKSIMNWNIIALSTIIGLESNYI